MSPDNVILVAPSTLNPHAFHQNLPEHHKDRDGIPFVTKFAAVKARQIHDLAFSIQLKESLFDGTETKDSSTNTNDEEDGDDDDDDDEDLENDHELPKEYTLATISKKCSRLQSQLATLESLKHSGITVEELCRIVLHVLRLVSATVSIDDQPPNDDSMEIDGAPKRQVTLNFQDVGYIYNGENSATALGKQEVASTDSDLDESLSQSFALPTPAREALLSVAISIMSKKSLLRCVSNAAIFSDDEASSSSKRIMLILRWRAFFRLLTRTAPFLDEQTWGDPPHDSNSRQSTTLKRTVQLIRHARHFFDQGIRPPSSGDDTKTDATSRDLWKMVQSDVLTRHHSHACYRGLIMLYLFHPSRCSSAYYLEVMPKWLESWSSFDRCPEIDLLWMVLFCRARKHITPEAYDWAPVRKRLLTLGQYWLQIPPGGGSMDQSFPRAPTPRNRSCPSRLKVFVGGGSSYEEGIDFVAKFAKLLVANIGVQGMTATGETEGYSEGTSDILRLLHFLTPYFHPSNLGNWTFTLGAFLHYFCFELCRRVGTTASMDFLNDTKPAVARALVETEPSLKSVAIPPHELVAMLDCLSQLCQQALYSKNSHVGRAGEAAMVYLAQIDPVRVIPPFLDFATRALDVSAVNLSHQAPSALSAMTRLLQPALRRDPSILLARLPQILTLSLAGIDSNDQNKTIRTLILYRNLVSWVPVGSMWKNSKDPSMEDTDANTGTFHVGKNLSQYLSKITSSGEYKQAISGLPETSFIFQQSEDSEDQTQLLQEEASSAMTDWVLGFLDRIYDLFRAAGEREKSGKTTSGVASRHSSSDVQQARNVSRILKECFMQVFAAMDEDSLKQAIRSVARFLSEESLPSAAKDVSSLCQAVGAVRIVSRDGKTQLGSPGLNALVPILTEDLDHVSSKTLLYRIRCLAGAVRAGGKAVYVHREPIRKALQIALSSSDKHVYKTGCKLLRHTLSSQSESYPVLSSYAPRGEVCGSLGRSAQLDDDAVDWCVPDGEQLEFVSDLLQAEVIQPIARLCSQASNAMQEGDEGGAAQSLKSADNSLLRQQLRTLRYSLRGCSGLLLERLGPEDDPSTGSPDISLVPHEEAVHSLFQATSKDAAVKLGQIRRKICGCIAVMTAVVASETVDAEVMAPARSEDQKSGSTWSSDTKICKELSEIALLLLTRRGANFRCQEAKSVWKAQKQLVGDYALSAEANHLNGVLERSGNGIPTEFVLYKDGEDGGKTIPRRLVVTRLLLFYEAIQRNASFEIPRRLRRMHDSKQKTEERLFNTNTTVESAMARIENLLEDSSFRPLDGYESLADGLFALSCHSNTQVRASAIGVVDYALTRFGWLVRSRVPRLLAALSLQDENLRGKYGVPSCKQLSTQLDSQGKRRRLAEVMKGVCSILALSRSVRESQGSERSRMQFVRTLCESEEVISLLPTEEMQKMVYYFQSIFSPFRSKFYACPRVSEKDRSAHETTLLYLFNSLTRDSDAESSEKDESGVAAPAHWRRRLLEMWFILSFLDMDDLQRGSSELVLKVWKVCFELLETEMGQPIQRMALGLLGRLMSFAKSLPPGFYNPLREKLREEAFCIVIAKALVFDHKEDASYGGQDAQWSAGVEDMIRDAGRNVAPRTLFPFMRTGQSSGVFKISHAQFVDTLLSLMQEDAYSCAEYFIKHATELAGSPPSEDQRNQLVTAAEIFGGLTRGMLHQLDQESTNHLWEEILLPFVKEVVPKIPMSVAGAFFDAVRYGLQLSSPGKFYPFTAWSVENIDATMWQGNGAGEQGREEGEADSKLVGSDGFTLQSKWLYLASAILIEMNWAGGERLWFTQPIQSANVSEEQPKDPEATIKSWELIHGKLLPRLLGSLGHPYESCRDHIAGCLFRICGCYKTLTAGSSRGYNIPDPTSVIVDQLSAAGSASNPQSKIYYNSLITIRKFISYCTHLGNAKVEFSKFTLPLLPIAFGSLRLASGNNAVSEERSAAVRALEAEVLKGYRYSIAEISVANVISYGSDEDIKKVLEIARGAKNDSEWHVRHASANFLRCFQGSHKFLFGKEQADTTRRMVTNLLADDRMEVSSAAMAALTGILAATQNSGVMSLVDFYAKLANKSKIKKKKALKNGTLPAAMTEEEQKATEEKEKRRAQNQQRSVFFLCASVLAQPYDTPAYVPVAIAAISKHSFERSAPRGVREIVKKCCGEYKRTHMSDNWEIHRKVFNQEQLEALEDVVSTPHYYA